MEKKPRSSSRSRVSRSSTGLASTNLMVGSGVLFEKKTTELDLWNWRHNKEEQSLNTQFEASVPI